MIDEIKLNEALNILKEVAPNLCYEKICEMTSCQQKRYKELLDAFISLNSDTSAPLKDKGDALERLSVYMLENACGCLKVLSNVRTSTNEIDVLVSFDENGKILCANGTIDPIYRGFIGECKNYNKKIGVTWVGKFCSLLQTTQTRLGILFSYHGMTGKNWTDASGLCKKFYLHKERREERFCVIDFNVQDFQAILEGVTFYDIIDSKLLALQLDTGFSNFLSPHPQQGNPKLKHD